MWKDVTWIGIDSIESKFTHMANPFPVMIGDALRIFYNGRDEDQKSYILSLDFDMTSLRVLSKSPVVVIGPGKRGEFDDCGCSMGCISKVGDKILLYYLGWNLSKTVPFRNAIGVLELDMSFSVKNRYRGPIVDRSLVNPLSLSYPFVFEKAPGEIVMWYGSHIEWGQGVSDMLHTMKYAISTDGIKWIIEDVRCLEPDKDTMAFSRPFVKKVNDEFHMWYSYRGEKYRIGYAKSRNGIDWIRYDDEGGMKALKGNTHKNEMVCYPGLFDYNEETYMVYNGNGYGLTGIGIAKQTTHG